MKFWGLSFVVLLTICSSSFPQNQPNDYETNSLRQIRDKSFRERQTSPLSTEDFAAFKGLSYFSFDAKYQIKATLVRTEESKTFLIPTSTGGSRKYLKIGDLNFKLNGLDFSLSAFAENLTSDIFVPFRDSTNGEETYSAGRYLYAHQPKSGNETILDFNLAFNPNCAYSPNFACTLPPKENFLKVEIKAGEKKFVSLGGKTTH